MCFRLSRLPNRCSVITECWADFLTSWNPCWTTHALKHWFRLRLQIHRQWNGLFLQSRTAVSKMLTLFYFLWIVLVCVVAVSYATMKQKHSNLSQKFESKLAGTLKRLIHLILINRLGGPSRRILRLRNLEATISATIEFESKVVRIKLAWGN